jgi:hypothetical protein
VSDAIYPAAKEKFLGGQLNWLTDPIQCVLVGTANYTFSAAHASMADVPVAARIATSGTLSGRTATLGVADASDISFGSTVGNIVNAVILYRNSGTDSSSPLIAYLDTALSGLPLNPNGAPIAITWDNGASKIFVL